jgi:hypothetical protein
MDSNPEGSKPPMGRVHARRLREIYRSAGWPVLDTVEIELVAAGHLERVHSQGHDLVRVTNAGMQYLAAATRSNRKAFSAHEALVEKVAQTMGRDGRIVWTNLSLRAWLEPDTDEAKGRWKMCRPDVFSIRNSSVQAYLEPIVHEIKVSRADLLGDLKLPDKRNAYLDIGGQCWYVLGRDAKGRAIGEPEEIPQECGVLVCTGDKLEVLRNAQKRTSAQLPFAVWMALAKATPIPNVEGFLESSQMGL